MIERIISRVSWSWLVKSSSPWVGIWQFEFSRQLRRTVSVGVRLGRGGRNDVCICSSRQLLLWHDTYLSLYFSRFRWLLEKNSGYNKFWYWEQMTQSCTCVWHLFIFGSRSSVSVTQLTRALLGEKNCVEKLSGCAKGLFVN